MTLIDPFKVQTHIYTFIIYISCRNVDPKNAGYQNLMLYRDRF